MNKRPDPHPLQAPCANCGHRLGLHSVWHACPSLMSLTVKGAVEAWEEEKRFKHRHLFRKDQKPCQAFSFANEIKT